MDETVPVKRSPRLWLLLAAVVCLCGAAILGFALRGSAWLMPAVVGRIEAESGLRFAAAGPLEARLVPWLGLRATDVRLGPAEPDARPLLYADAAEIELSWASALRGKVGIARLRLRHARFLTPLLPPAGDLEVASDGPEFVATVSSGSRDIRVDAHRDGGLLALDHVTLRAADLGLSAAGAGRLSLRDPIRLVLNAAVSAANQPAGAAAVALSFSTDGLVLERANWRRPDGLDVSLFGHVAPGEGALRFEGGVDAASETDKGFDASAAFDGAFGANGANATLSNIDVRTAGSHLAGEARLTAGDTPRLAASLQVDRLDFAALKQSPLAPLAVPAAAFAGDLGLHFRADMLLAGGKTIAEGVVLDAARHAGTFDLHELAARSLWGAPLHATGRVALGPAPVAAFDPLQVSYGDVEANGRLTLDLSGARPVLNGELATGPLRLDKLFAGPPPLPPEPMTRHALAAAKANPPPVPLWSTKPVNLPATVPIDADLTLAAPRLAWRGNALSDVRARLSLREDRLTVADLTADAYGGRLAFSGSIERTDPPHVTADLHLTGGDLAAVLSGLGGHDLAARGDISAQLAAEGDNAAALVSTLAGSVTLANGTGVVPGIDMSALSERLKQRPARPTDIIQLARAASGGSTPFTALRGHLRIEHGVARTDDVQLTAPAAAATISGSLDLARQTLNVVSAFQLTDPAGVPPLIVSLDGPLAEPRRIFDISRLQSYLLHGRNQAPAAR